MVEEIPDVDERSGELELNAASASESQHGFSWIGAVQVRVDMHLWKAERVHSFQGGDAHTCPRSGFARSWLKLEA
jgi:hypothetical protein